MIARAFHLLQFPTPIELPSAGTYYFVFERTGARDESLYFGNERTSTSFHDGLSYTRNNGVWDAGSAADSSLKVRVCKPSVELDYCFIDETATPDIWWNILTLITPATWITKILKWYNGSSWVEKPLKYHNGSTWVTKPVKIIT